MGSVSKSSWGQLTGGNEMDILSEASWPLIGTVLDKTSYHEFRISCHSAQGSTLFLRNLNRWLFALGLSAVLPEACWFAATEKSPMDCLGDSVASVVSSQEAFGKCARASLIFSSGYS